MKFKGNFVLKNWFETFLLKISGIQKSIRLGFGMTNSIIKHLTLDNNSCIRQIKSG